MDFGWIQGQIPHKPQNLQNPQILGGFKVRILKNHKIYRFWPKIHGFSADLKLESAKPPKTHFPLNLQEDNIKARISLKSKDFLIFVLCTQLTPFKTIWPEFCIVYPIDSFQDHLTWFLYCVPNWVLSRPYELIFVLYTQITHFKTIWPNFIIVYPIDSFQDHITWFLHCVPIDSFQEYLT